MMLDIVAAARRIAEGGIAGCPAADGGLEPFPGSPRETITNGLVNLPERLHEAKRKKRESVSWQAEFTVAGSSLPSASALVENAKRLAAFAHAAQQEGLVPVLAITLRADKGTSALCTREAAASVLAALAKALAQVPVDHAALVLALFPAPDAVAPAVTLDTLRASVPSAVPLLILGKAGLAAPA
ncbi:MAG: fructose-bisphosphate aldolase [Patescibacteria group bacterium]|nr:fructose-bisphosphate aldolase [Patescibacteria group bacterium]